MKANLRRIIAANLIDTTPESAKALRLRTAEQTSLAKQATLLSRGGFAGLVSRAAPAAGPEVASDAFQFAGGVPGRITDFRRADAAKRALLAREIKKFQKKNKVAGIVRGVLTGLTVVATAGASAGFAGIAAGTGAGFAASRT